MEGSYVSLHSDAMRGRGGWWWQSSVGANGHVEVG